MFIGDEDWLSLYWAKSEEEVSRNGLARTAIEPVQVRLLFEGAASAGDSDVVSECAAISSASDLMVSCTERSAVLPDARAEEASRPAREGGRE